jgi:hypothetical protein
MHARERFVESVADNTLRNPGPTREAPFSVTLSQRAKLGARQNLFRGMRKASLFFHHPERRTFTLCKET